MPYTCVFSRLSLTGADLVMGVNYLVKPDQQLFGYQLTKPHLLRQALVHTSFANEHGWNENNERLEFLGDAVLELIISEHLFNEFPETAEGELARLRAAVVCEPTLARWARRLQLGNILLLGVGEEKTGGRNRDSVLSDAMEAVIGAHYLSEGIESTRRFVIGGLKEEVENALRRGTIDPKSKLQEALQAKEGCTPEYHVVSESGPDHAKVFTVDVIWGDQVRGRGLGRTKKDAQQRAAADALQKLNVKRSE